jgi:hypothetical protein
MGHLLQSIQGLVQVAHQLWSGRICEAGGLAAEDGLTEHVVEEGVLHIKLLKWPVAGGNNGEHHADSGQFDNRVVSLVIVGTKALCEHPEDPASLVTVKNHVRDRLVGKNPFGHWSHEAGEQDPRSHCSEAPHTLPPLLHAS